MAKLSSRIIYRAQASLSGGLTLWTVQPYYVWEGLLRQERMWVDPAHPGMLTKREPDPVSAAKIEYAYNWLRCQAARRLLGWSGHYPWWASVRKPDLRWACRDIKRPIVRIELSLARAAVLLINSYPWSAILDQEPVFSGFHADQFLAERLRYERQCAAFGVYLPDCYSSGLLGTPLAATILSDWELSFDVRAALDVNDLHAVFERLELRRVVSVEWFP